MRWIGKASEGEIGAMVAYARRVFSRAVQTGWERGVLSRADAVLSTMPDVKDIEQLLARVEAAEVPVLTPRPGAWARFAEAPRLGALCDAIGALPIAADVLVVALIVEIDPVVRTLAGYLRGGPTGSALTVSTLLMVFGEERAPEILFTLGAGAPLRRHRLLEHSDKGGDLVAAATVRAAPRLLRWMVDPVGMDDEVAEFAHLYPADDSPALSPTSLATVRAAVEEVAAFIARQRQASRPCDLVLRGPRGAGRSEIAREAARQLGVSLLATDVASLLGQPSPAEAAGALLREAVLLDAQVLLTGGEALTAQDEASQRVKMVLGTSSLSLVIAAGGVEQPRVSGTRPVVQYHVRMTPTNDREAIWGEILPELPAEEIGSLYRVGVGAITRSAEVARLRAQLRGAQVCSAEDVAMAIRAEFETDLGTVATRVEVSQDWNDLVIPDDTGRTIAELVDQLRHRSTVLGRWGFQRKLGKGLGTTALFLGEPGTGKTMVAGLIARELGLELYQIDLSRVLSKWIGETEKNLAKVFDAAETGHVVLLFDEADSLLGKRTSDTKNANDRYANIETNYILQRLEQFYGVAILTSNLESSIDPALSRRLSFELRFPFPDEEQRAELWRRMMPAELPTEGEFDYTLLAERFELSGGYIRNIVLRAAYLAAAEDAVLSMAHLLRAAEYEYRDHGMLVARGRLKT
jgi:hypothetical protein